MHLFLYWVVKKSSSESSRLHASSQKQANKPTNKHTHINTKTTATNTSSSIKYFRSLFTFVEHKLKTIQI